MSDFQDETVIGDIHQTWSVLRESHESTEEEMGVIESPIRWLMRRGEVVVTGDWNSEAAASLGILQDIRHLITICLQHPWDGKILVPSATHDRRAARRWSRLTGERFRTLATKPRTYLMNWNEVRLHD